MLSIKRNLNIYPQMGCFFVTLILLSACSSSPSSSTANETYPSQVIAEQGFIIEQQHDIRELKQRLFITSKHQTALASPLLTLFIQPATNCQWHLSKWHKETGQLSYLLDCDEGLHELIFMGSLESGSYQITDIYHHNMGIWLSELTQAMSVHADDVVIWASVIKAIEADALVPLVTALSQIKHPTYYSQILACHYSEPFADDMTFKMMQRLRLSYPNKSSMLAVQQAINANDYPQAQALLTQIEARVGSSALSQLKHSTIHHLSGNKPQAYRIAIHSYKTGIRTQWPLVALIRYSIENSEYLDAIALLKLTFTNVENWNDDWLLEFNHGQEFIQQAEYIEWLNTNHTK